MISVNQESASYNLAYLKGTALSVQAFQDFREEVRALFEGK
jgi:hypothetical protein